MPDRDWWAALWPNPVDVLRQLGIQPDMSVIDLCCGDGYFTAPLAKLVGGKVYALDLDPAMIDQAKVEVANQGASVRQWFCADATEVATLLPEGVDCVLIANTFHGAPDQLGLARSVRGALRPHGLLIIVNWHPLPREKTIVLGRPRGPRTDMRMSPKAVEAIVALEGFHVVKVAELRPFHYGIIFRAID